jgi:hypothetical protein
MINTGAITPLISSNTRLGQAPHEPKRDVFSEVPPPHVSDYLGMTPMQEDHLTLPVKPNGFWATLFSDVFHSSPTASDPSKNPNTHPHNGPQ